MSDKQRIEYLTVTVDRVASDGRNFQSLIHIGPDGWSQSGEDLGETRDLAEALFEAAASELNRDSDDERAVAALAWQEIEFSE